MTHADRFAEGLNRLGGATAKPWPYADHFSADAPGPKFTRIVQRGWSSPESQADSPDEPTGLQRSVHAFVENATGHVYKAEGWKKPAKGVRYATVEDALEAYAASRGGTGYLYAR